MNSMELVHFVSTGDGLRNRSERSSTALSYSELIRPTRQTILRARQYLLNEQRGDGSWLSAQKADASLASQLVLMLGYLGQEDSALVEQAAATILDQQLPNGGWSVTPGGAVDLSTSVQAYFALKLSGIERNDERLSRARNVIRSLGGADVADVCTRFFLALLGQVGYDRCHSIPPELLLWNSRDASDTASLAAVWSHRPVRQVGIDRGVRELFVKHSADWPNSPDDAPAGAVASILAAVVHICEWLGWTPLRTRALNRVQSQLLHNVDIGEIEQLDFCALVWHIIALHTVGYHEDTSHRQACDRRLRELVQITDDAEQARPRIRCAAISDTIVALRSLAASGMRATHPLIASAIKWLTEQRRAGLTLSVEDLAGFLQLLTADPDSEDAVESALPPAIDLGRHRSNRRRGRRIDKRARMARVAASMGERLLRGQNADGGWGSLSGKSAPAATGAVLEALQHYGSARALPTTRRAVDFLRRSQRADGSWDSADRMQLIHGTSLAVRGLLAAGVACDDEAVAGGVNWILVHQQTSGGWGERPAEAADEPTGEYACGEATPSQTAWAVLALVAAGRSNSEPVRRAVDFLLETQQEDGSWHEAEFVLRDAASGRWYQSSAHAAASPLFALSRWVVAATDEQSNPCERTSLRLVGAAAD